MDLMLSELQRKAVWEGWLSSEIRSNYFADLCGRYQRLQKGINWGLLVLSSAAFFALVSGVAPSLAPVLAFLTAALSAWSLVAQNQKLSTDSSDLSNRWLKLAAEFQSLWDDMYSADAPLRLRDLMERGAEISKSSHALPHKPKLMDKWEDHVVRHHTATAAA